MSRTWKIALSAFVGVLAVAVGLIAAGFYIARSGWLREQVRERVVAEAEKATGGRVEIGRFLFDWSNLTAEFDGFTIHGTEPAGSPPLLSASKFFVRLKIVSLMKKDIDILSARVESPRAFLLVATDGSTNLPAPKLPGKRNKGAVATILDLKVGEFTIADGSAEVHAAGRPPKILSYDLQGRKLQSKLNFQPETSSYSGSMAVAPLDIRYGTYSLVQLTMRVTLSLGKDHLQVTSAKLSTESSYLDLSGDLRNFAAPAVEIQYKGDLSLPELGAMLKLKSRQTGTLAVGGLAHYSGANDYLLTGQLRGRNLTYSQNSANRIRFSAASSYRVVPNTIDLSNLTVSALGGTINGRAIISDLNRYEIAGRLSHFDARTLAARSLPYNGKIDGAFSVAGLFSDPQNRRLVASAKFAISPAESGLPVNGSIDVSYDAANSRIIFAPSYIALPKTRLDFNGVLGQRLQLIAESQDLNDLAPALSFARQSALPVALQSGSVHFEGFANGQMESPRLQGRLSVTNFVYSNQTVDSLNADIDVHASGASFRNASLVYQKVKSTFQGSVGLSEWKLEGSSTLAGTANLQNVSVQGLLALAGRKDIPLSGTVSVTGQLAGTVANPRSDANFTILNGAAYQEPFDRITGSVESAANGTQTLNAQWKAGSRQITLDASYRHAANDFRDGTASFRIVTNQMALAQFATVRNQEPGLTGNIALNATGELAISPNSARLKSIDGKLQTTGVMMDAILLSDLTITARTDGTSLHAHLQTNLVHADISGDGTFQLSGDYPGNAQINFAKVDLAIARKILMPSKGTPLFTFGGLAEGRASIAGSLLKPDTLTAQLEIPQFELRPDVSGPLAKELSDVTIRNTQPIRASVSRSLLRIESARFTGPNTDLSLLGSVNFTQKDALNLNLNGNLDLKLARTFNSDIDSSGNLLVRVRLRGSFSDPQLGGTADLRNGNISLAGFPNGLSKANGRIVFDENRANIEKLVAQTGGGTIQLDGFTAFGGPSVSFRLTAIAKGVRVRYPEGVSSVSDANLTWTGSSVRSVLGGDVTVHKVAYNQQSDLGSVLSIAAGGGPAPTQAAPTGLLGGTQFDVRVQTAPDISFQTGLVTGLQTEANLRLRGTAANPSLLGRITVNSGNIEFLGNKYLIQEGTISFFNPVKIEPILNIDLQTQSRGVDVTLSVSGPITKLNVTYRSDPPLQFSDIVGLLATGKTPSDPTIAARETDTQQTWQQLGASALVGQAIANPVSGRLQRFFGVSKIKIDPLLPGLGGAGSGTGGSNPGARLSLEQQVAPNVTFDYVISTNSTSSQIVRVEWAFSKHWSAVILREENSAFGIDFQYKKRFK